MRRLMREKRVRRTNGSLAAPTPVIVVALVLAMAPGCQRRAPAPPPPVAVQAAVLAREPVTSLTRFSATVRERQRIELSFKVPGTIVSLLSVKDPDGRSRDVHEGDVVRADTEHALAQLDDADYRRRVEAAKARLAESQAKQAGVQASLTALQATFARIKALRERGSVPQQAYDEILGKRDATDAELDATRREISAASVALRQAEDDWANCRLGLPIPRATVSRKYVETNARVPAGQPVFQIMDLSSLHVAFGVSDRMIGQFHLGQPVTVTSEVLRGERFVARVTKIPPAADLRTRTFEVEVTIDHPGGLKPGMVVTISLGRQEEMMLLPLTAIVRGAADNDVAVYVVAQEQGHPAARKRRVQLGAVYDNRIQLLEGAGSQVRAGDQIIVHGAFRVSDGQAVRLLEMPDPADHLRM
jgi:RND family efflux transporter MFP subunit